MGESSCFSTSLNSDSCSENACTLEAISKVRKRPSREKGSGLQKKSVNIQISASFKYPIISDTKCPPIISDIADIKMPNLA